MWEYHQNASAQHISVEVMGSGIPIMMHNLTPHFVGGLSWNGVKRWWRLERLCELDTTNMPFNKNSAWTKLLLSVHDQTELCVRGPKLFSAQKCSCAPSTEGWKHMQALLISFWLGFGGIFLSFNTVFSNFSKILWGSKWRYCLYDYGSSNILSLWQKYSVSFAQMFS